MNDQSLNQGIASIPALPGIYALQLRLTEPYILRIGALGEVCFLAGDYIYVGSACGAGGLRGRLSRHVRGGQKLHWHIDYLRQAGKVVAWAFTLRGDMPLDAATTPPIVARPFASECEWAQALARLPGATVPLKGFGASDCSRGCPAHLTLFPGGLLSVCDLFKRIGQHLDGCQVF